jgi:hypothetical protein
MRFVPDFAPEEAEPATFVPDPVLVDDESQPKLTVNKRLANSHIQEYFEDFTNGSSLVNGEREAKIWQ